MKILFEVTSQNADGILLPLAKACNRAGIEWACFFTGDGVLNLESGAVAEITKTSTTAIACEFSWESLMKGECPVSLGSQTDNSEIVGKAERIISL
jgi:hypothetical protein